MSSIFQILGDAVPRVTSMIGCDSVVLDDAANVNYTKDGYLTATPCVARTGIQLYDGSECGLPGRGTIRIYRPMDEVFAPKTMRSATHRPMTIDHPPEPVNADNWKKYAVGQSGEEAIRDGERVRVPLVLMDAGAIEKYKAGKCQLSAGYTCDIKWQDGTAPNGEQYDGIQTNIDFNHIAVVDCARGGPSLKIGDATKKDSVMTMKQVMVDGLAVEMPDMAANIVQRAFSQMQDTIKKLMDAAAEKKKKDDDEDEANDCKMKADAAKIAEQTATIATLQKQLDDAKLTPQKLDALVTERAATIGKARAAYGNLQVDGKTMEQIRRDVVDAKLGAVAKGWTDEMVSASFNTLTAGLAVANDGATYGRPGGGYQSFTPTDADPRKAAFEVSVRNMQDAWMRPEDRQQRRA